VKLVPRLSLWFMLCVTVLLAGRGVFRVEHQSAAFDADMQRDHRFIGRALAGRELQHFVGGQLQSFFPVRGGDGSAGRNVATPR
jgi:hypothetical protein